MISRLVINYTPAQEGSCRPFTANFSFALNNIWGIQTLMQFILTVFEKVKCYSTFTAGGLETEWLNNCWRSQNLSVEKPELKGC